MNNKYDWIIIGGGPAGYAAALYGAKKKEKIVLFENEQIGGTCLNLGCIPVKCLLEQSHLLDRIREYTQMGVLKESGKFSFKRMQLQKYETVKKLTSGVKTLLARSGVKVIQGTANLLQPGIVTCRGEKYYAKKTLIATGSKPSRPPIPGIEDQDVLDSTGMLGLDTIPSRLVVIGGGVIGLEFASLFTSLGSNVIVLEALDRILPAEDMSMVALLQKNLENKGVQFIISAKVRSVSNSNGLKCVRFDTGDESTEIEAERVMVATGRKANLSGIESRDLGLKLDNRGYIQVDGRMRTNLKDVWAAGDIVGQWQLAHAAYIQAETVIRDGLGESIDQSNQYMPRCIYTSPGYAAIGISENEAQKSGQIIRIGTFPYSANGMALAGNKVIGMIKIIADQSGRILGAHMMGDDSIELISQVAIAMASGTRADQFETIIYPHPTLSEMVREAILDSQELAIHKPMAKI